MASSPHRTPPVDGRQLELPILAQLMPRGDGSYILRPKLPDSSGETWMTARAAARILQVSPKTIYRLADAGHIRSRKPSPHLIQIELASLNDYKRRIEEPDFWAGKRLPQ